MQGEMKCETKFKSYLKNQWPWYWEQNWFDKAGISYSIMSKSKYSWWRDNSYADKLVTERLSQTTYDFPNIWGIITRY